MFFSKSPDFLFRFLHQASKFHLYLAGRMTATEFFQLALATTNSTTKTHIGCESSKFIKFIVLDMEDKSMFTNAFRGSCSSVITSFTIFFKVS